MAASGRFRGSSRARAAGRLGGAAKDYLYDPAGRAVTVLDPNGNWLRGELFAPGISFGNSDAGGRHIATYSGGTAGSAHVIYLVAHGAAVVGKWPAYNNVAVQNDETQILSAGPLANGRYAIRPSDQHGALMHLGSSPNGPYGPGGIIHIVRHKAILGENESGAGVHGGRASSGGPKHATCGCVRTCNQGMVFVDEWLRKHPNEPLHYLRVKNNQLDVRNWFKNAEGYCASQSLRCNRLDELEDQHPSGGGN
ncbi:MAG: hypothetical protein ACRD1Y_13495 [Terriglobales bacterium]